ncbi:MAG TPA: tetratricopeptide repeat protein [Candidatus Acidoferrales bacterium]|nr:tetratricopeptide repeat protein [Candidatus Acidoferrales bacterium]
MFAIRRWLTALARRQRPLSDECAAGLAALAAGRYDEACTAFSVALGAAAGLRGERLRLQALNKRGVAHVCAGRRAEALADFQAALALDPRFAPARVNVGNIHLEEGRLAEAIASYEAAIRGDDRYAPAYANLGVAYRRLGEYDKSVRALKIAARLEFGIGPLSRGGLGRA